MDSAELNNLLARGETLHTEFKQWPLHPDDLAAAITAFANTDSGRILLGVDDQGKIAGIAESERDRAAQAVDNVAFNNIQPPVTVVLETVSDPQGQCVLVANVPKGSQRPYRTNRGVYYVRTASGRRQASREELPRMFQATESLYYDETPLLQTSLADMEAQARDDLLRMTAERGIDIEGIEPNRVLINRIEIRTPGKLPNSVTLESLPLGVHALRNPMIYSALLRVGLVTDAGSGVPRIIRLTRQATGREPAYSQQGNELVLTLPRKVGPITPGLQNGASS